MDEIAFVYVKEKNPRNLHLVGVPLRDLTAREFSAFPEYVKKSIRAQEMYQPYVAPVVKKKKARKSVKTADAD